MLLGMLIDDQFGMYDLSLFIVISIQNIMQNADIMSAFFCKASSIAAGMIRLFIYSGSCLR